MQFDRERFCFRITILLPDRDFASGLPKASGSTSTTTETGFSFRHRKLVSVSDMNSWMWIHRCEFIHVNSYMWSHTCEFIHSYSANIVASLPLTFPFSAFCGKRLLWMSVGLNMTHTFLSHKKPSSWHFLALAKLRSITQVWNHPRNFQLVNKGWLLLVRWQLSRSRFAQAIVRTFLATDTLQRNLQPA